MLKKAVAALVVAVVTGLSLTAPAKDQAPAAGQSEQTSKIRDKVQQAGAGKKPEIRVKMRDGTELRGHVSDIAQDSFTLTDARTSTSTSLTYADVRSVKGMGLSTGAKVAIVAAIGIGIVAAAVAIHGVHPLGHPVGGGY